MSTERRLDPQDTRSWSTPADADDRPVTGYHAALAAAISEGQDDMQAGRVKPADQVWKELGLE